MSDLTTFNSHLQSLVDSGAHSEGWLLYESLETPMPRDDRLGGLCLWYQGKYEDAKIPFYRAVQRGEVDAMIDLIAIHSQLNELSEALEWIETSRRYDLSREIRIRVLLYESELYLKQGKSRQAIKVLKQAWVQVNIIDNSANLIAKVAQSLAAAFQSVGDDGKALEYLEKALQKTTGFWETVLKVTQAYAATGSGDFRLAQSNLLNTQEASEANQTLKTYHLITNGNFAVVCKKFDHASQQFKAAILAADRIDNKLYQLQSRTWASATHIASNNLDQARAVLMPLAHLELAPAEEAMLKLRQGVLHMAMNEHAAARAALEHAVSHFSTLEHKRELSWSMLRLAELHLECGDATLANHTLERVSDVANEVGGTAFLVSELNLMGVEAVTKLSMVASVYAMHSLAPTLEPGRLVSIPLDSRPLVRRLRVITLGKPMLLAGDRNVTPRLNKAMELISYLVLHPQSSLERILDAVFPDSDAKAAANYFHQIRHKLTRDVPELRVAQDKQTKLYSIDTGTIPLESDYEDVVKLLNHATQNELHQALEIYRGAFMPHIESEWAEEVRNNVEWLLVRSGLRVVQDLYDRGNFEDCRKLTEKLRKVAPLDAGLGELLVRATNEIDGLLAAKRTLTDMERYFNAEVGELPPGLESLKRDFKLNIN